MLQIPEKLRRIPDDAAMVAPHAGRCDHGEQQKEIMMNNFKTVRIPALRHAVALDGLDVRVLATLGGGSIAHFELAPGQTSHAVAHHTVEEVWFFLKGRGEFWRKFGEQEEVVPVDPGVCITIPLGTHFQLRSVGHEPLAALGVTMPPFPGEGEAYMVQGLWQATIEAGVKLEIPPN